VTFSVLYRRTRYQWHNGLDINAVEGTDVRAAERGEVTRAAVAGQAGNRLDITLTDRTYLYTADDERFWQSEFTNTETHDQWTFTLRGLDNKVLTVYKVPDNNTPGNWILLKDYIYRDGQLLAAENHADATQYHFSLDHLGTPRGLTDASGGFISVHTYFGFGEEIELGGGGDDDDETMVFTGHERDFNSNAGPGDDLDYMHARYCNPNTGRFLSVDPAMESADPYQPQSWNRFNSLLSH